MFIYLTFAVVICIQAIGSTTRRLKLHGPKHHRQQQTIGTIAVHASCVAVVCAAVVL